MGFMFFLSKHFKSEKAFCRRAMFLWLMLQKQLWTNWLEVQKWLLYGKLHVILDRIYWQSWVILKMKIIRIGAGSFPGYSFEEIFMSLFRISFSRLLITGTKWLNFKFYTISTWNSETYAKIKAGRKSSWASSFPFECKDL